MPTCRMEMRRPMNMRESEMVETCDRWKRRIVSAAALITTCCLLFSGYRVALNESCVTIAQLLKSSWEPRMMTDCPRVNHSALV